MTQNSTKIKTRAKNLLHEVKLLEQNLPRLEAKAKYGKSAKDRRIASESIPSTMALIKSKKEEYANLNKLGEWNYA